MTLEYCSAFSTLSRLPTRSQARLSGTELPVAPAIPRPTRLPLPPPSIIPLRRLPPRLPQSLPPQLLPRIPPRLPSQLPPRSPQTTITLLAQPQRRLPPPQPRTAPARRPPSSRSVVLCRSITNAAERITTAQQCASTAPFANLGTNSTRSAWILLRLNCLIFFLFASTNPWRGTKGKWKREDERESRTGNLQAVWRGLRQRIFIFACVFFPHND